MPKAKKTEDVVTEVGERVSAFRPTLVLRNLRRVLNVKLAEQGLCHKDAADRAGVTPIWWSRTVNAAQITPRDLARLAKGAGCSVEDLVRASKAS